MNEKYKNLLEKLSRSEELKEDNKKLITNETNHDEVDEIDLEDKREPQRILYNTNKAKNTEHLEYSVIYLSDSEEPNNNTTSNGRAIEHEEDPDECNDNHEFELFRHTPLKRRVSMRDEEDEDTKQGNDNTKQGNDNAETRRPKKQYKFVAAVRKKEDREQLTGHECEQCAQFYAAIYGNDVAAHATTHVHAHHAHKSKEELIGHVSRHKQLYTPPHTPEGYWDLSFPHTTQGDGE